MRWGLFDILLEVTCSILAMQGNYCIVFEQNLSIRSDES